VCRKIDESDGRFTRAKDPRRLHWIVSGPNGPFALKLEAVKKKSISKSNLIDKFDPRDDLMGDLKILQSWLAARYRRHAFPDAFDLALAKTGLRETLETIVREHGQLIEKIFCMINEPAPNCPYELEIVLMFDEEKDGAADAASNVKTAINHAFEDWSELVEHNGPIDLANCEAISAKDMTFAMADALVEWRFEYLSFEPDISESDSPDETLI
jgi:hypothetical protein